MKATDPFFTSHTLITRVKNKEDHQSWDEFSEVYHPFIRKVLFVMKINTSDHDDIHQEILLRLWKYMGSYQKTESRFRSWLSLVVRNMVYDYMKVSKRYHARSFDDKDHGVEIESHLVVESDIEKKIEREWKLHISKMAFERLKTQFSDNAIQILQLSLEGKSQQEISVALNLKPNSVKVLKSRVKASFEKEVRYLIHHLEEVGES